MYSANGKSTSTYQLTNYDSGSSSMIETRTSSSSSSSSSLLSLHSRRKLYRKCIYIGILLFTILFIYMSSSSSSTSTSVTTSTTNFDNKNNSNSNSNFVQIVLLHHEPSIRIFRCIIEMIVLFLCTSFSIYYYIQHISATLVHTLLFTSVYTNNNNQEEEYADDNDDEHLFDDPFSEHIIMPLTGIDQDRTMSHQQEHEQQLQSLSASSSSSSIQQQQQEQQQQQSLQQLAMDILNIAFDTMIYTSITFILYIISALHATATTTTTTNDAYNSDSSIMFNTNTIISKIVAPTFPLLLCIFIIIRLVQCRKVYYELYILLSYTMSAPFYTITFRDGMIGDILTSMVRPMQDIAFTICYILFGLRSYYWQSVETGADNTYSNNHHYDIVFNSTTSISSISESFVTVADATVPAMERNWIVHTAILPACMISPLWWRFLQTIRQSYDTECRWPYLGNAFKYFIAAQVAMIGVYHPTMRHHPIWIMCFIIATLYQIYWDVFMDWGLLVQQPQASWWKWALRTQRLYPNKSLYWILLLVNTLLRFCWTLNFIPFHYLSSKTGVLMNNFSNEAWANILVPIIACAEIIRRALWGLIRVEWEAIKVQNEMSSIPTNDTLDDRRNQRDVEMIPMKVDYGDASSSISRFTTLPKLFSSDNLSLNKKNLFGELCLYTTLFAVLGLVIAAHRGTL